MSNQIVVFSPGTMVKLQHEDNWWAGRIQAVRLQGETYVDYNVILYKDGERKTVWVDSFEVERMTAADNYTTIGFRQ